MCAMISQSDAKSCSKTFLKSKYCLDGKPSSCWNVRRESFRIQDISSTLTSCLHLQVYTYVFFELFSSLKGSFSMAYSK